MRYAWVLVLSLALAVVFLIYQRHFESDPLREPPTINSYVRSMDEGGSPPSSAKNTAAIRSTHWLEGDPLSRLEALEVKMRAMKQEALEIKARLEGPSLPEVLGAIARRQPKVPDP